MSNSNYILSRYNEFSMLRQEIVKIYPSLTPEYIQKSPYHWILSELQLNNEKQLIQLNESLIKEQEKK